MAVLQYSVVCDLSVRLDSEMSLTPCDRCDFFRDYRWRLQQPAGTVDARLEPALAATRLITASRCLPTYRIARLLRFGMCRALLPDSYSCLVLAVASFQILWSRAAFNINQTLLVPRSSLNKTLELPHVSTPNLESKCSAWNAQTKNFALNRVLQFLSHFRKDSLLTAELNVIWRLKFFPRFYHGMGAI